MKKIRSKESGDESSTDASDDMEAVISFLSFFLSLFCTRLLIYRTDKLHKSVSTPGSTLARSY